MNRKLATACAVAITTFIVACSQQAGSGKKADNVAMIDGIAISRVTYDKYIETVSNGASTLTEQQRKGLLDNLVRGVLLSREAESNGAAAEDGTRATMELQRLNVLSQAATARFLKNHKATDAELHSEYDLRASQMDKVEYHASHILVKTEDEAKKIVAQLKAGGNFAQIARAQSIDPGTKDKGGDLDWFGPSSMTAAFSNALAAMKKGETSSAPVQTEYGWHVLHLTDTRTAVAPPFESVKDQIEKSVDGKKVKAWLDELIAKAKITKSL